MASRMSASERMEELMAEKRQAYKSRDTYASAFRDWFDAAPMEWQVSEVGKLHQLVAVTRDQAMNYNIQALEVQIGLLRDVDELRVMLQLACTKLTILEDLVQWD